MNAATGIIGLLQLFIGIGQIGQASQNYCMKHGYVFPPGLEFVYPGNYSSSIQSPMEMRTPGPLQKMPLPPILPENGPFQISSYGYLSEEVDVYVYDYDIPARFINNQDKRNLWIDDIHKAFEIESHKLEGDLTLEWNTPFESEAAGFDTAFYSNEPYRLTVLIHLSDYDKNHNNYKLYIISMFEKKCFHRFFRSQFIKQIYLKPGY